MKCSFCEQPLVCKACSQPFRPREANVLTAAYQAEVQVLCPECQKLLACKVCGFVYGEEDEGEE
jgi:hypothetical protein